MSGTIDDRETTGNDRGERETIRNEERGCGFLDHGKGYLRSPPRGSGGVLPSFVEFDPPIPYLERDKFRGYEFFPGIAFELAVTGAADVPTSHAEMVTPLGDEDPRLDTFDEDLPPEFVETNPFLRETARYSSTIADGDREATVSTDPPGEVWRHIVRSVGSAEGDHAGDMEAFRSRDLYMHIGASYYETPEEFIQEVEEQGLSKAIPVSETQEPPVIQPGKTRLFLVHPDACEDETPGIIGYVYLSRTVYTEDSKGRFPNWAKKQERSRDDMDLVHIGDQIYEDGTRATTIDEDDEFGNGDDEAETVVPSDKPGRDVESVDAQAENALDSVADVMAPEDTKEEEFRERMDEAYEDPDVDESEVYAEEIFPSGGSESNLDEDAIREQLEEQADDIEEFGDSHTQIGAETWVEASVIEVPRPAECPDCGQATDEETMEGGGVVTYCRGCGWDNSTSVNAALVESDLRDHSYNALRSKASEELDDPPANPDKEELVRAVLSEWGLI